MKSTNELHLECEKAGQPIFVIDSDGFPVIHSNTNKSISRASLQEALEIEQSTLVNTNFGFCKSGW
jgi:hypothetical protein